MITVYKLDHHGQYLWHYTGQVLERTPTQIVLEARFNRDDYPTDYHTFKKGDRFVEWFYTDRWYNVFAIHHRDTDELEGWYCNITRPARFEEDAIYAEDLALDVMIYPDGRTRLLDEDEFIALDIDPDTRHRAEAALEELLALAARHAPPFSKKL